MSSPATETAPSGECVLIFAPTGQDASLLSRTLREQRMESEIFRDIHPLCARIQQRAGAVILAEEVLTPHVVTVLNETLNLQEPWSDIPIVLMTTKGEANQSKLRILRAFAVSGNVTLLERPFLPLTLLSSLQVALRARRRQFEVERLLILQKEATRLREEFISIASHELKTPLTSLKLQTQMNQRLIRQGNQGVFAPEKFIKLIETTNNQVDRLSRLVEDMLDVSRILTGKLMIEKSEVDLTSMANDVVEQITPQLTEARCTIEVTTDPEVIGYWDRYRLEQVINNLLSNAIRYAPGKPVKLRVARLGDWARLSVHDLGIGIAPANLERIFQRFERAVDSASISGLGLGLYICRQIIESHGGNIRAESELGKGSTFTVELPLKHESALSSATVSN